MRSTRFFSLLVAVWLLAPAGVGASGYHPEFDQAVKEANLIVLGQVVNAEDKPGYGRVYRMKVGRVYKGDVRPGQELVFIDLYHSSTASYRVAEGEQNLTFLVSPVRAHLSKRSGKLDVKYMPIRNFSTKGLLGKDEMKGWLFLLDQLVVKKPANRRKLFGQIIRQQKNRYILHYAVSHYPKDLTADEARMLCDLAVDRADDALVASYAIEKLKDAGRTLDDRTLLGLFKSGSKYLRSDLLAMVNPKNVNVVQDHLFALLSDPDDVEAEQEIIDTLAKNSPSFFKNRLTENKDLPLWILIPCLQALGVNGSAVGRSDFPKQVLAASPYTLRFAGELIRGNEFWGVLAMGDPDKHAEWRPVLPLLEPALKGPDTPVRRLVVALMRTLGRKVTRSKDIYQTGPAKQPPPLGIRLKAGRKEYKLGDKVVVTLTEVIHADTVTMALEGPWGWNVEHPKSSTMSGGFFHEFKNVDLPRQKFLTWRKGEESKTTQDLSSWFTLPGRYRLSAKRLYRHDGGSHDLDAWTGVVFAEPIEIVVVE